MKRVLILSLVLMVFSVVCWKGDLDETPRSPVIDGKVIDVVSRKGVPGVVVMVMDYWTDGWNYSVPITGWDTTDQEGNFKVLYSVKGKYDSRILKLKAIPGQYQTGARINDVEEQCVNYDYSGHDPGAIFGGYHLEDEGTYTIELLPNTYAYFVRPTIPAGWENNLIKITSWDFCLPLSYNSYCYSCSFGSDNIEFPLKSDANWEALAQPIALRLGKQIRLRYDIYQNGNLIKTADINMEGVYGDTTAIVLPL